MKAALAAAWLVTLLGAFAIGRLAVDSGGSRAPDEAGAGDLRAALSQADPLERTLGLAAFLTRFGPDELPEVIDLLEDSEVELEEADTRLLMLSWARFDAAGAFETARQWPGDRRRELEETAIWAWGFLDGAGALRALEATGDPELTERLRPTLFQAWVQSPERESSTELIAQVEEPRIRRRLAFLLVAEISRGGVDAVIRWAESLPDDLPHDFKTGAFYYATGAVSRKDPQRAAEWFAAHRAQPYSKGSLKLIARKWTHFHDAPAFFEWVLDLPTTGERQNERAEAVAAGFQTWYERAPDEAVAWLAQAPRDPALDPAVVELVRDLTFKEPGEAVAWAGRIQDEAQRRRSLQRAGRIWLAGDPEAARDWLARSDLPEELRQSILSKPRKIEPPERRSRRAPPAPSSL